MRTAVDGLSGSDVSQMLAGIGICSWGSGVGWVAGEGRRLHAATSAALIAAAAMPAGRDVIPLPPADRMVWFRTRPSRCRRRELDQDPAGRHAATADRLVTLAGD